VGRNGALTGYAGGLPRKQALLQHEGAQASMAGTGAAWPGCQPAAALAA
jgi:methylated-DNA-[protein]-cysteine S-methyltransferase